MEYALELKDVSVTYEGRNYRREAVKNLSLKVAKGEVFGFLGPNGAGKTTTIKTILGLIYPLSGEISIFGAPAKDCLSRKEVGYMPEIADYYWYLTPRELLFMYAGFFRIPKPQAMRKIDALLEISDLKTAADVMMKYFSKGMMQKVSLAQSLINDPGLLILDEPTGGLDPLARMKMRDLIKELRKKGKTVFFSSHELSEVELISDRVGVLKEGRLIKDEKTGDILHKKGHQQSLENYFLAIIGGKE